MGELENENKMLFINVMMDFKEILNFKVELVKINFKRNIFIFYVYVYLFVYKKCIFKRIKCVIGRFVISGVWLILVDLLNEIKDEII